MTRRTVGAALAVALVVTLAACDPQRDGTRHNGFQGGPGGVGVSGSTILSTAKVRWSFDPFPNGDVGQPIIADGMVIAPVWVDVDPTQPEAEENWDQLVAFDRLTGAVRWRTTIPDAGIRAAAGGGRIVVVGQESVRALELATGRELWVTSAPDAASAAPVVAGGTAYVAGGTDRGPSDTGTLTAYDVETGRGWRVVTEGIDGQLVTPAVSGDVVYLAGKCAGAAAYRRSDGARLWFHPATCTGGGSGGSAAVRDGRVTVSEASLHPTIDDGVVLDAGTGREVGAFSSVTAPAVGSSNLITTAWRAVENRTVDGRTVRWRHQLSGMRVARHPVVAGQQVLVVAQGDDEAGYLLGLGLSDGRQVLRVPLGRYTAESEGSMQQWLAVGEQVAAVSIHGRLVVIG